MFPAISIDAVSMSQLAFGEHFAFTLRWTDDDQFEATFVLRGVQNFDEPCLKFRSGSVQHEKIVAKIPAAQSVLLSFS